MTDTTQKNTTPDDSPGGPQVKDDRWRMLKIAGAVIVTILVIIWIGLWLDHRLTHVSSSDAHIETNEITVSSRLAGKVTQFTIMQGDHLQNGDLVAQLYDKPDKLKLKELQAKGASIKARIAVQKERLGLSRLHLSGGIKQTKHRLASDVAAAQAAKAKMNKAHNKAQRAEKLYKVHGATRQQRDTTHYNYLAAKADYKRAQSEVTVDRIALTNAQTGMLSGGLMSVTNPDVLKKDLAVVQSKLREAQAKLAHQKNRISDLAVRSSIDGVVDKTFIENNEYVSAGQPILMMHAPGNVWVEAKIKETKMDKLKVGQHVSIQVDAWPNIKYSGHLRVIGHAATNQFALLPNPNPSGNFTKITQRIPVRIAIDKGPKKKLSPGMMVEVDIDITHHSDQDQ